MPAPIMCGVVSIAAASDWAGSTLSSNTTLAFFVFQSTVTDLTPFTRLSEPCTVLVQGGQCRPVTRKVALVGSAEYRLAVQIRPRAIDPLAIRTDSRMAFSPGGDEETETARARHAAGRGRHLYLKRQD